MRKSSSLGWSGLAFLGVLVVSAACSSTQSAQGVSADQAVTALRGTIKSSAGQALSGVTVKSGSVSATTDAQGRFELKAPAGKALVRFASNGFVETVRPVTLVDGRPTQLDVTMLPLAAAIPLDATAGGTAAGSRGAALVAPAGAFVDEAGAPVTGTVNVHLTPLDPSAAAERAAAPGFTAEVAGTPGMLESFGMLDITVKQGDKKLQVAAGKEIEIRIPPPAATASPEATIPLWSFDEGKGVWVEEGTATYDATSKAYVGKTKHMSMWNCDKVYLATCVCGLVKEKGGAPLPGARVDAEGLTYFGTSSANADQDGKFCVAVRKDSDVNIAAYHKSGGGQARAIKSSSADTNVPPTPGDARCADVGVWEVERDVFVGSNGQSVSCGSVSNPFANGCAADLFTAFGTCYKPEGSCTMQTEAGGATVRYANGAYFSSSMGGGKYYSSNGQLCATTTFESDASGGATIHYALPNGKNFTMAVGAGENSDMTITCPDGSQTKVTAEQRQALEACSGGGNGSGSQAQQCTVVGGSGSDAGALYTACTDDSTCGGNVCCTIPNDTQKICLPKATCDAIPK